MPVQEPTDATNAAAASGAEQSLGFIAVAGCVVGIVLPAVLVALLLRRRRAAGRSHDLDPGASGEPVPSNFAAAGACRSPPPASREGMVTFLGADAAAAAEPRVLILAAAGKGTHTSVDEALVAAGTTNAAPRPCSFFDEPIFMAPGWQNCQPQPLGAAVVPEVYEHVDGRKHGGGHGHGGGGGSGSAGAHESIYHDPVLFMAPPGDAESPYDNCDHV